MESYFVRPDRKIFVNISDTFALSTIRCCIYKSYVYTYISIHITLGRWCSKRNTVFALKDNRPILSAHLCHWRVRSKPLVKQVVRTHTHQTHCATLMDRVYSCGRWMTPIARVPRGFRHGFVTRRKYSIV